MLKKCIKCDVEKHESLFEAQRNQCFDLSNAEDWSNLRPLWKRDNILKSNKLDHDLIQQHNVIVQTFYHTLAQVKEGELLEHPESP
jgi:hypothetical protein